MKRLCCLLLAALPLTALGYPIDVERQSDGVKVDYSAYDTAHDLGAITLNNYGDKPAECVATFNNGPETPRVRRARLDPGQRVNLSASFKRDILRLRIKLVCKPVD